MTNNAEREAFEKWARGTYSIERHYSLPDQYAAIAVQVAWGAWQARAQASGVPDGWKWVPKHATQHMLDAFGIREICWAEDGGKTGRRPVKPRDIWEAMLAAAPIPPKSASVPEVTTNPNEISSKLVTGVPVERLQKLKRHTYYDYPSGSFTMEDEKGEWVSYEDLAELIAEYK
jgi:hypothetical protein